MADHVEKALERFRKFVATLQDTVEALEDPRGWERIDRAAYIMELDRAIRRFEGNAHPRIREERGIHRTRFFRLCRGFGGGKDAVAAGRLADAVIDFFVYGLPEYEKPLKGKRDTVARLLRTYSKKVGGRGRRESLGRDQLEAEICDAVGWSKSGDAQRQARHRRKKRVTT